MWRTLVLSALVCTLSAAAQTLQVDKAAAVVRAAHARGDFDGVVVITQHGKVLLQTAVGEADRMTHAPLRVDSVFRLASLTKQVTALLVLQEVQKGRIRLDEPVGEALQGLPVTTARVTVQQLLQHISGLPNPSDGPENAVPAFYTRTGPAAADMHASAFGFCSGAPKRDPDSKFEYNNCDYLVLGAMLEAVTGKPFATLVRERVTAPLGLKSWGVFGQGRPPKVVSSTKENGTPEDAQNPATYGAAGALYGNALDVARWNDAILHHRLLSAASTETMFHAERNLGGEALGTWSYDVPGTAPALRVWERQGDIGATRVLNLMLPDEDASLVILANSERADLFDTYSKHGLGYDLLKASTGR